MPADVMSLSDALNRHFELPDAEETESDAVLVPQSADVICHSFVLAQFGFLIPAEMVSEIAEDLAMCRLPKVPRWFWGMANLRGNILPIFDFKDLLDLGQSDPLEYKLLVLHIKDSMVGVVVNDLPSRVTLRAEHKLTGQTPLPERLRPFSRDCYRKEECIWVDWDVEEFFLSLSTRGW